jgi:hypothetical protein
MSTTPVECCPPFDPKPWDEQSIEWDNKLFLQDRVRSVLHIPLNFGAAMRRSMAAIQAADAMPAEMIVLADENSLWGADVFVATGKEIPGARMARISGTFLTKAFEGSFRNMRSWIGQMRAYAQAKGKTVQQLYFYYTTCPKCAKKYGKNYVVILARV